MPPVIVSTNLALCAVGAFLAQTHIDETTKIPLGIVASIGVTVFLVGMWVSNKLTNIFDRLKAIETKLTVLPCTKPKCTQPD